MLRKKTRKTVRSILIAGGSNPREGASGKLTDVNELARISAWIGGSANSVGV
jgi:hypothetical protein